MTAPTTVPSPLLPFLTVQEVASLLRVNVKTVYAEIASRRLKAIRVGRTIRIPREAVAHLVASASPHPRP